MLSFLPPSSPDDIYVCVYKKRRALSLSLSLPVLVVVVVYVVVVSFQRLYILTTREVDDKR